MSTPDTITQIPLEQLHESPFNPRRTFAGIDELAANIRAEGCIHEPLLVRPRILAQGLARRGDGRREDGDTQDGYEVVFGHRRLRAAAAARLATVPCMVRALTDAQARSAQISENLQRDDIHPIEEAEGFKALIDAGDATADQLAERLGKSRSHVYGRLKLLQACPEVRKACLEGRIGAEVALLIARLRTDKLQAKALQYIKARNQTPEDGGKESFRRIRAILAEHFNTALKDALFDPVDAALLPDAGACTVCPKRAGNAPEFADIADQKERPRWGSSNHYGADVCTDPDCFAAKKAAHLARQAAALEAAGKTVVAGAKARAALSAVNGVLKPGAAYVPAAQVRKALAAARPKKGRGGAIVAPAPAAPSKLVIQDPRTGKTLEAYRRDDLIAAGVLTAAEKPAPDSAKARETKREAERKEAKQAASDESARRLALLQRVREAMQARPRDAFDLQIAAGAALAAVEWTDKQALAALLGVDVRELSAMAGGKWLARQDAATLSQLVMDCALIGECDAQPWNMDTPPALLLRVAAHYGVDAAPAGHTPQATAETAEAAA